MNRLWIVTVVSLMGLALSACGDDSGAAPATATLERHYDSAELARGRALFQANCAVCHGGGAQGAFNWRVQQPDGRFPPPPLNGSGHAWHHPREQLHAVIRNGTQPDGNMPAWGGKLSDTQIEEIISWFQSLWPDEVYTAWAQMQLRAER